jgi:alpha-L-fucosidase
MRWVDILLVALLISACAWAGETKDAKEKRMAWWNHDRFGLFIHWGLYSVLEGAYGNTTTDAEWIMQNQQIPVHEYEKLQQRFNPVKFDAKEWARIAKEAGVGYVVITTKHHDGFDLFDSKVSAYSVMNTPFHRDIMRELSAAVRGEGLKMGWYHSIMDWHHPDYIPPRPWNPTQGGQQTLDKYDAYLKEQVRALLTNYGPISVMWFDGQWEPTWNQTYGQELANLCRTCQPNIIINNRVSRPESADIGDYMTPEQFIPENGFPGQDWESCITMNDHWGYCAADHNWKSTEDLIKTLIETSSKGGNLLLNVGPRPDGTFPPESVERLKEIGAWLKVNGESIYGTTASIMPHLSWGRSTTRFSKRRTEVYLHIYRWLTDGLDMPTSGPFLVDGLHGKIQSAHVLGGGKLTWKETPEGTVLDLPDRPQGLIPVVKLVFSGAPEVRSTPAPDHALETGADQGHS